LAAVAALALGGALAVACTDARPRRDVVVIVTDTTRADRLSVYGHARPTSPNLEALARDGVVFERAWSTASWTLPAHASLLTSQFPTAHGAHMTPDTDADSNGSNPAHLREEAVTLAELLRERGWRTAAFAGAGWLSPEFGLLQGYEVRDAENNRAIPAAAITSRALRWMATLERDEPLHLLVNYFDPHWPYEPQPPFDRYAKSGPDVAIPSLGELLAGAETTPAQQRRMLDLYDGEIEYMDRHIGRLLDGLRAAGRYEDAMIVVIADHGELFGEHGDIGHGAWLWEELVHVPLIVKYPGHRRAGERESAVVSTVDPMRWIADELGIALPADTSGVPVGARDLALAEEFPSQLFVKLGGERMQRDLVAGVRWPWKLIASSEGARSLFRIEDDPREASPLDDAAETAALDERIRALRSTLVAPEVDRSRRMSPEAEQRLRELGYVE
ncbi:MAG: sulfatase, partial [Myxococcales bacterium]|nr:sulfatase [Myxococcales bacterium]